MRIQTIDAREHRLDEYSDWIQGYRALVMLDDDDIPRGELVWRLATGRSVEVTEFGIYRAEDRRRGWGSKLVEAGLADMRRYFAHIGHALRRVYAFCDSTNEAGRAFYEARGFDKEAELPDFYGYCNALLYVLNAET